MQCTTEVVQNKVAGLRVLPLTEVREDMILLQFLSRLHNYYYVIPTFTAPGYTYLVDNSTLMQLVCLDVAATRDFDSTQSRKHGIDYHKPPRQHCEYDDPFNSIAMLHRCTRPGNSATPPTQNTDNSELTHASLSNIHCKCWNLPKNAKPSLNHAW